MSYLQRMRFHGQYKTTYCGPSARPRCGFTLVELLVVISIIALLIAILLPALASARKSALRVKCLSQIRQVYLGASLYAMDFKDTYPIEPIVFKWTNAKGGDDYSHPDIGTPNNPSGWYQFRILGHINDLALVCPSIRKGVEMPIKPVEDVKIRSRIHYAYRYNTVNARHELPDQGLDTRLPTTYPKLANIRSTTGVLFTDGATARRPNSNTSDEIYHTSLSDSQSQWAHEIGGNLALFDGSAHFMPNFNDIPLGTSGRSQGLWPTGGVPPFYSAIYLGTSYSFDVYIKAQLGG